MNKTSIISQERSRRDLFLFLALIVIVFLSNKWLPWDEQIDYLKASDVKSYMLIAENAPALPPQEIMVHYLQRSASLYLAGLISTTFNVDLPLVMSVISICLILVTLSFFFKIITRLTPSSEQRVFCSALLIFNPYAFRYYLIARGMIPDLTFLAGMSISLFGLLKRKFSILFLGLTICSLGRQTALMLIPGFILWILASEDWRHENRRKKAVFSTISLVIPVGIYTLIRQLVLSYSIHGSFEKKLFGLFSWLRSSNFDSFFFAEHILRIFIPHLTVIFLGGSLVLSLKIQGRRDRVLDRQFLILLFLGLCIAFQPFVVNPEAMGKNANRLSALGIIPMILSLGFLLEKTKVIDHIKEKKKTVIGILLLLFVGSLHHMYTILGPSDQYLFFIQELCVAGILSILVVRMLKPESAIRTSL